MSDQDEPPRMDPDLRRRIIERIEATSAGEIVAAANVYCTTEANVAEPIVRDILVAWLDKDDGLQWLLDMVNDPSII